MTYIISAFETEARALIDSYKLQKRSTHPFKLFYDEEIFIIISGMGQNRAEEALEYLSLNFPYHPNDTFINLGTCAGQKEFSIGTLVQVKLLQDEEESHRLCVQNKELQAVSCFSSLLPLDRPTSTDIAEMEAIGIYRTINNYFPLKKISFLKIVSDNFNPIKHEKAFIIKLTQDNLVEIKAHIELLNRGEECL